MRQATYIYGYKGLRLSRARIEATEFGHVHPEVRRRAWALMDACPFDLGIGSAWRDYEDQKQGFLHRYTTTRIKTTDTRHWNGKTYYLKPGFAPMAAPGTSYHEATLGGYCLAIDFYNANPAIGWANDHATEYGFVHFADVNDERWHFQPREIPHARGDYNDNPSAWPLRTAHLPGDAYEPNPPQPAPKPTKPTVYLSIPSPDQAEADPRWLQAVLNEHGWGLKVNGTKLVLDGKFGNMSLAALKEAQAVLKVKVDGIYGQKTAQAMADYVKSLK